MNSGELIQYRRDWWHLLWPFAILAQAVIGLTLALLLVMPQWRYEAISLPEIIANPMVGFAFQGNQDQVFTASVVVQSGWVSDSRWQVIVDDELLAIHVDDVPLDLSGFTRNQLSNWGTGITIDLPLHLGSRETRVLIAGRNHSGPGGVQLRPHLGLIQSAIIALSLLPSLWLAVRVMRLSQGQAVVLLLAMVVALVYWAGTPLAVRSNDAAGHLEYIRYVHDLGIPAPNAGWMFYHPPSYYLLGAWAMHWAEFWRLPPSAVIQLVSWLCWFLFVIAGASVAAISLPGRPVLAMAATAGIALWPAGIMHSCRLGNDLPFYACSGLAIVQTMRFWRGGQRIDFVGLLLWSGLALLVKTNAVLLVGWIGLLLAWRACMRPGRRRWSALGWYAGVCGIAMAINQARTLPGYLRGQFPDWLVSNVGGLGQDLAVGNGLRSFVPLDLPVFLTQPWANCFVDEAGRQNHWNQLMRTAISGEWGWDGDARMYIALAWGWCLIGVLAGMLVAAIRQADRRWLRCYADAPLIALVLVLLIGSACYRAHAPFAPSSDFRYSFPVLIPLLVLGVKTGWFSRVSLLVMVSLSVVFFLIPS